MSPMSLTNDSAIPVVLNAVFGLRLAIEDALVVHPVSSLEASLGGPSVPSRREHGCPHSGRRIGHHILQELLELFCRGPRKTCEMSSGEFVPDAEMLVLPGVALHLAQKMF